MEREAGALWGPGHVVELGLDPVRADLDTYRPPCDLHDYDLAGGRPTFAGRKRSVNPSAQVTGGTEHSHRCRVCWWSWGPSPRTIGSAGGL